MNFDLDAEQQALKDSVRRFIEREYPFESRAERLGRGGFSPDTWTRFAQLGWLGAGLSEAQGGHGGGPIETAIILEELGRGLVLEPFLACAVAAAQAIAAQADSNDAKTMLRALINGESLTVLVHAEPGARSYDGVAIATRADAIGAGWRLTGAKSFVLGGPQADTVLVTARTSGQSGDPDGVSLLACPTSGSGVSRHDYRAVDGRPVADFTFDRVELTADALLGVEGSALGAVELALDHATVGMCAEAVGAMDAALWLTRDYLKTRSQFGVTLNSFQALQHRMADMLVETELARSMLYRALAGLDETDAAARSRAASAAKAQIGEAGWFVGGQAVQLHGGIGVTEEYVVGHYFKRLTLVRGLYGSTDGRLAQFSGSDRAARLAAPSGNG